MRGFKKNINTCKLHMYYINNSSIDPYIGVIQDTGTKNLEYMITLNMDDQGSYPTIHT
jgi:hypothetical protein